jgi:glycosyltransferase involved in cell wall biosynthesis
MIRVVHVQKAAGISGSERHLLSLLPALADHGVEVQFLALLAPGGETFTSALTENEIPVAVIPAGPDLNPWAIARLARLLRRRRPDLVHTHLIHADLHGQVSARVAGVPGVSTVHGAHAFYGRQPYQSAARAAGHLARRTIAISNHVARTLTDAGVVPPERLRVVPYGIDTRSWAPAEGQREAARRRLDLPHGHVVVLIASRLIPGKGHDQLVRAVADVRRRGLPVRLLVAGDGPIRSELTELARCEDLQDAVSFLGFVPDIRSLMAASDMVAFPTEPELGEGFGLAALEAMAAARPVIATRVAALPEVVEDEETGLLVSPRSGSDLRDAIQRLASDEALRTRLGQAGRRRAKERFSLDAQVSATIKIYGEATRGNRLESLTRT